jgi:hypothetical protein
LGAWQTVVTTQRRKLTLSLRPSSNFGFFRRKTDTFVISLYEAEFERDLSRQIDRLFVHHVRSETPLSHRSQRCLRQGELTANDFRIIDKSVLANTSLQDNLALNTLPSDRERTSISANQSWYFWKATHVRKRAIRYASLPVSTQSKCGPEVS